MDINSNFKKFNKILQSVATLSDERPEEKSSDGLGTVLEMAQPQTVKKRYRGVARQQKATAAAGGRD